MCKLWVSKECSDFLFFVYLKPIAQCGCFTHSHSFNSHLYTSNSQQCVPGLAHPSLRRTQVRILLPAAMQRPPGLHTHSLFPQCLAASPALFCAFPPSWHHSYTDLHIPFPQNWPLLCLASCHLILQIPLCRETDSDFPDLVSPPFRLFSHPASLPCGMITVAIKQFRENQFSFCPPHTSEFQGSRDCSDFHLQYLDECIAYSRCSLKHGN